MERLPLSNKNRTKYNINTRKVKRQQKQATENHSKTTALQRSVINYMYGGGGGQLFLYAQPHPQCLSCTNIYLVVRFA